MAITIPVSSAIILYLLWGVSWVSGGLLILYTVIPVFFVRFSPQIPFACLLSDAGNIEVNKPNPLVGTINKRSFYNSWVIFLCVKQRDVLMVEKQHDNPRKWFIVFFDSVSEQEYRLLARLINTTHTT